GLSLTQHVIGGGSQYVDFRLSARTGGGERLCYRQPADHCVEKSRSACVVARRERTFFLEHSQGVLDATAHFGVNCHELLPEGVGRGGPAVPGEDSGPRVVRVIFCLWEKEQALKGADQPVLHRYGRVVDSVIRKH